MPIEIGDGPVVLLVHGQPGSGGEWRPVAELLAPDHHVVAPDRPGWGGHPRPATTLTGNAEALARLIEDRQLAAPGQRCVVAGHSLGGGIALELALGYPELVGALVLVGSVGVGAAVTGIDRLLAVPVIGSSVLRAGAAGLRRAVGTASRMARIEPARPLVDRAGQLPAVRAAIAEAGREMDERDRRSFLVEQRALLEETPGLEGRLASLRLPVAVVQGASDRIVVPAAGRRLAEAIPGAELVVVPGAGHRLPFERPEVVAAVVRRYGALVEREQRPGA